MKKKMLKKFIFYLIITAFYMSYTFAAVTTNPIAQKGYIDLSNWDFKKNGLASLNGEWEFYWNQLLFPDNFLCDTVIPTGFYNVPGDWKEYNALQNKLPNTGFATFRLKIKLDSSYKSLILSSDKQVPAQIFYANGKIIAKNGEIGKSREEIRPELIFNAIKFETSDTLIDLIVQVANYQIEKGGLIYDVYLGDTDVTYKKNRNRLIVNIFLMGSFVIMVMYHLGLYFHRKKDKSPLFFAIAAFNLSVYFFHISGLIDIVFPNMSFELSYKILRFSLYATVPTFGGFMYILFPVEFTRLAYRIMIYFSSIFLLIIVIFPSYIHCKTVDFYRNYILISATYTLISVILAYRKKRESALIFLIGYATFFLTIANDILFYLGVIHTTDLTPIGLYAFIFSQTYVLSSRFSSALTRSEKLSAHLEDEVRARTSELVEANDQIKTQKEEIEFNHRQITDSIKYASKIQTALLSLQGKDANKLPEHFILYRPKNVVSGDFFWIRQLKNKIFIAIADCTGHGVPGAFMSMLGIAFLNEIFRKRKINNAGNILEELRIQVKSSLYTTESEQDLQDGMEIAFCIYDTNTHVLEYSGAGIPLYVMREGNLMETKPTPCPVGYFFKEMDFVTHEIQLQSNDIVYLASDGYTDQLGGKNRERFKKHRFKDLLENICHKPLIIQKEIIEDRFMEWIKFDVNEQVDDIMVFGMRI